MYKRPRFDKLESLSISSRELFALTDELFALGCDVKIKVTGNSMLPFLRNIKDSVELSKTPFEEIKVADIVLALRHDNAYVLHRVFKKKKDCFYMIGDAQKNLDGPYPKDKLVAKATAIYHGQRRIDCKNIILRFLVRVWMLLLPCRLFLLRTYFKLHGFFAGKFKNRSHL